MQLTVLGAGTCLPYSSYSAPGYLLQFGELAMLLDAGPGTVGRLSDHSFDYRDLRYILISHLHPDHTLDLLTLIQAFGATPDWTRTDDLNLIGCTGLKEFIARQLAIFKDIGPDTFALKYTELTSETVHFPDWSLSSTLTGHTDSSIAFRINTGQKSVVYTGDVANPESLVDLCRGADLLVCECSFPGATNSDDHLNAGQVGRLAQASNVKRLLLTHLYPPAIQANIVGQVEKVYDGKVEKAHDGLVISI